MSGVPVFSTHGRGGGWELIGGASTDLTGLSSDEARALFLAAGPRVSATPELKSALRKLTSALPEPFQAEAEAATTAFKIDPSGWGQLQQSDQPRFLAPLTDAVIQGRQVELDYQGRTSTRRVRTVHPLGLVTKRNVWYLLAGVTGTGDSGNGAAGDGAAGDGAADLGGGNRGPVGRRQAVDIRTYRVGRVRGVALLDEAVIRPPSFDLDRAWENIVTEVERQRTMIRIRAIVPRELLRHLRWVFGSHQMIAESGSESESESESESGPGLVAGAERPAGPAPDDRVAVVIDAHSARSFAGQIAGFGNQVELTEAPDEVFAALDNLSRQLYDRYCNQPA